MNILIVDDEQDVKYLFEQKFRREIKTGKIELTFAFSGKSALEKLEHDNRNVSLVLSDINMPEMTGLELLKQIKSRFNSLQVWIMTAYSDQERYQQAREDGCAEYMTKPIDFDVLKGKIFSTS